MSVAIDLSEYKRFKSHVLVACHTDYSNSLGGTEKVIFEQALELESKGVGVVSIYPLLRSEFEWKKKQFYRCIVDGLLVDRIFTGDQLSFLCDQFDLKSFFIHHLKDWQLVDCERLLSHTNLQTFFFVHDFYAFCPKINMTCLNYVGADATLVSGCSGGKCATRFTNALVADWRKRFFEIMKQSGRIIVPSNFVRDVIARIHPEVTTAISVQAPVRLELRRDHQRKRRTQKLKIAYLGYNSSLKGYDTWLRLIEDNRLQSIYEFVQIGGAGASTARSNVIKFNHYIDGPERVVEILEESEIDLVLLWSVVPETFSFTLHEAMAAGKPILTNPMSGNISTAVQELDLGKVLPTEIHLKKFLLDEKAVRGLLQPRPQFELRSNDWFLKEVGLLREENQLEIR